MFWIALLLFILALAALAFLNGKLLRARAATLPYVPAGPLFSPAERSFLGVLDQAVGSQYRVFGKVRVADVAAVRTGLSNSAYQSAFNRIRSKHFDFVVCRGDDLSVVCAVELNDESHSRGRRKARDEFLAEVCRTIDLPLIVVQAKAAYSLPELRAQFESRVPQSQSQSMLLGSRTHVQVASRKNP